MEIDPEIPISMVALTDTTHELYCFAEQVMQQEFPFEERRDLPQQRQLIGQEPGYCFYALLHEGKPAGMLANWNFSQFIFIEHFALLPEFRSRGLGSEILQRVVTNASVPVILEVEPGHDEKSLRRIRFYERFGFRFFNNDYAQPPYHVGNSYLPMRLMYFSQSVLPDFYLVKKKLYLGVYGLKITH